jgi:hypothetical protein
MTIDEELQLYYANLPDDLPGEQRIADTIRSHASQHHNARRGVRNWWVAASATVATVAAIAIVAVVVTGKDRDNTSASGRRGPAAVPAVTIHLDVGGQQFALPNGGSRNIDLRIGHPVPITVAFTIPAGDTVKDVYLVVSGPNDVGFGAGPTGKVKILKHHDGPLAPGQSVSVTWSPTPVFDSNPVTLWVYYTFGGTGINDPIAQLHLSS